MNPISAGHTAVTSVACHQRVAPAGAVNEGIDYDNPRLGYGTYFRFAVPQPTKP